MSGPADVLIRNEKMSKQEQWNGYTSRWVLSPGHSYTPIANSGTLDLTLKAKVWKYLRPEGDFVTAWMTEVYT